MLVAGTGHDIARIHLAVGVWKLSVTGRDRAGHRLGGTFTLPIN
jgi:hypothetical protein